MDDDLKARQDRLSAHIDEQFRGFGDRLCERIDLFGSRLIEWFHMQRLEILEEIVSDLERRRGKF